MKGITLFVLLLWWPFWTYSQAKSPSNGKTSIGVSLMPNLSFRSLNYKSPDEFIAEIRNSEERVKFNFSTGFTMNYNLTTRWSIQTGILYARKGYQTRFQRLNWAAANSTSYPSQSKTVFDFSYIEFPLILNYRFLDNKIVCFYSCVGLSTSLFVSKHSRVISRYFNAETNSQSSTKYLGYSRLNLSANIGLGIGYKISNKFTLVAEPQFQHSLNSIVINAHAKEYLLNGGIDLKFYYSL